MLKFDFQNRMLNDLRDTVPVFCGELSVAYTHISDDITKGEKPFLSPYSERYDTFSLKNDSLVGKETGSQLRVKPFDDGIEIVLECKSKQISEFGLHLPFNFLGKLCGGVREGQFLPNACFVSKYTPIKYWYLARPNGNNLVVCALSEIDGFRNIYSSYNYGHYITGLNIYADFDKVLKTSKKKGTMRLCILPVSSFSDCLTKLSKVYSLPFLSYEICGGKIGDVISLQSYGNVDEIKVVNAKGEKIVKFDGCFLLDTEGETTIIPYTDGKAGAEISVYAYKDFVDLYKKSMNAVKMEEVQATDGNLCEHQNWLNAMLKFLNRYKDSLSEDEIKIYEEKALMALSEITETDYKKAFARRTIFHEPHDGYPAYNIFKSNRVQELFSGISILIEAYKYFKDKKYLDYVIGTMDCLLNYYQQENGSLQRRNGSEIQDYSSVCAPIIPIIEAAKLMKDINDGLANRYLESAGKLAEYLYKRGFDFPTEADKTDLAQPEVEEGSISCTALQLLYYAKNATYKQEYVDFARQVLDMHDAYIIKTPLSAVFSSTLRWWETCWEGDEDGPAICNGHAWTIWRAEADYLYYALTGDRKYKLKAFNGFLSNLAKIKDDGTSYSIRQTDMIPGGGLCENGKGVQYRIAPEWSDRKDSSLSRYVFVRLCETFLSE